MEGEAGFIEMPALGVKAQVVWQGRLGALDRFCHSRISFLSFPTALNDVGGVSPRVVLAAHSSQLPTSSS